MTKEEKGLANFDKSLEQLEGIKTFIESGLVDSKEKDHLMDFINKRFEHLKSNRDRLYNLIEGPWVDKSGRINQGAYEGFYIVPLLEALASSAKDFPTAMGMIAKAANDQELYAKSFTMYPEDDPRSKQAYGLLIEMAPDDNWDWAISHIQWDT